MAAVALTTTELVVGIVGGGKVGRAFARRAAAAGVSTIIAARSGPDSLAGFARDVGTLVYPAATAEAVQPEIVLLAVPWPNVVEVLDDVTDWDGRILIDATNPDSADTLARLNGRTSSEVIAELSPDAHVVKAFNTMPPELLAADPVNGVGRRVVFYSGDHARAKAEVARLIARIGFAGVDLGGLSDGGRLQQSPGPLAGLNLIRVE
jgi:predicted dinucleotide-binding enzyme